MQFITGEDEEPVLGYKLHPSLEFVSVENGNFLPTSNTCINMLKLPIPTATIPKPSTEALHNLYDYAFANAYFGLSWTITVEKHFSHGLYKVECIYWKAL